MNESTVYLCKGLSCLSHINDLHKNPTIKNTTIENPTDFGKSIKNPTLKISGGIENPTLTELIILGDNTIH